MPIPFVAQTNVQLFNQLLELDYSKEDLELIHKSYYIACELFTGRFVVGKEFITHGIGTASILAAFNKDSKIIAAGMIHNLYEKGLFKYGEATKLSYKRKVTKELIGKEVEEIVYHFYLLRTVVKIHRLKQSFSDFNESYQKATLILLFETLEKFMSKEMTYEKDHIEKYHYVTKNIGRFVDVANLMNEAELAELLKKYYDETMSESNFIPSKNDSPEGKIIIPPISYKKEMIVGIYNFGTDFKKKFKNITNNIINRIK